MFVTMRTLELKLFPFPLVARIVHELKLDNDEPALKVVGRQVCHMKS